MKGTLWEMTWPEVRDIIDRVKVAIIPVGSNEQHGPHLPFQIDTDCVTYLSRKAAEKLYPQVLVTPPISMGVSYHHMRFPGTLTLRSETLVNIILDVCQSLESHGIRKVAIVNGHGGNVSAVRTAGTRAKYELGLIPAVVDDYYLFMSPQEADSILETKKGAGHACEFETSMALVMYPEVVRRNAIGRSEDFYARLPDYYRFLVVQDNEYSKSGVAFGGDPTVASESKGRRLIDAIMNGFVSFLQDFIKHDPTILK